MLVKVSQIQMDSSDDDKEVEGDDDKNDEDSLLPVLPQG